MSAGRLIGIARRLRRRVPMEEAGLGIISVEAGLAGDFLRARSPFWRLCSSFKHLAV
jgi:hypothetical protein